jgi:hypothetical protein
MHAGTSDDCTLRMLIMRTTATGVTPITVPATDRIVGANHRTRPMAGSVSFLVSALPNACAIGSAWSSNANP